MPQIDPNKIKKLYSWVNSPIKGLINEVNGKLIPDEATPYVRNARFFNGYITKRPGLRKLSECPSTEKDVAMMAYGYWVDDTTTLQTPMAWSRYRMYQLVSGAWTTVHNKYTTGTVGLSGTTLTGAGGTLWASNVTAGDRITITGASGYAYADNVTVTTVTNDTQLVISKSGTVGAGASYVIYRYLSGTTSALYDWCNLYGNLIFTNGADKVKKWTGGSNDYANVDSTNVGIFKFVRSWNDRLYCANLSTDPYNIQWCVSGDITNWTGTGSGNGSLDQAGDGITGLEVLKDQLITFQSNTIWLAQKSGLSSPPQYFRPVVQNIGNLCSHAFNVIQDKLYFIGTDNIYTFDLNSEPVPIGDAIKTRFFSTLKPGNYAKVRSTYWPEYNEWWIAVPYADATECNLVYVYNLQDKSWSQHHVGTETDNLSNAQTIYALGVFKSDAAITIDGLTGQIDQLTKTIDEYWGETGQRYVCISTGTEGDTYQLHPDQTQDDVYDASAANNIPFIWQSKDFGDGVEEFTISRIVMGYSDNSLSTAQATCYLSNDQGSTFALAARTVTLSQTTPTIKNAYFDFNQTVRLMRFKIEHSANANLKIHYFNIEISKRSREIP